MAGSGDGQGLSVAQWAERIAVGGLALAGLLVSVCGPMLRKANEQLRTDLADSRATVEHLAGRVAELAPGDMIEHPEPDVAARAFAGTIGPEDLPAAYQNGQASEPAEVGP